MYYLNKISAVGVVKLSNKLKGDARGSQRDGIYLANQKHPRTQYEPKCGEWEGVVGSQPMSTAVHMEPKKTLKI